VFSPLAVALITNYGWETTLGIFAVIVLSIAPLSLALATRPAHGFTRQQSVIQALTEAFGHRSYVLLMLGYFTCGFQTFFMGVHLPTYLIDRGLSVEIGGWTLALIGLFNVVGSIGSGWLGNRMPKRFILAAIYFGRSLAIIIYILLPVSSAATMTFGVVMGILWLSTIPPYVVTGGDHVWRTLAGHVARCCIRQPPARRISRGLARRLPVRTNRVI
jgi:cyanate permease